MGHRVLTLRPQLLSASRVNERTGQTDRSGPLLPRWRAKSNYAQLALPLRYHLAVFAFISDTARCRARTQSVSIMPLYC